MSSSSTLSTLNATVQAISRLSDTPGLSLHAARAQIADLIADLLPDAYRVTLLEVGDAEMASESANTVRFPLDDAVLAVTLSPGRSLTADEQAVLENVAIHASAALERVKHVAQMQQSLRRKEDELERLRRANMLISSRLRLEETLEAILQMALEVTGARYGIFRLLNEQGTHLLTRAVVGEDMGAPHTEALPLDKSSIMGRAALTRKTLCIADVHAQPWSDIYYPLDHALKMRSELVTPLVGAGGRLEGVLNLESPRVNAFSDEDAILLQSLAIQAVIAIQEVRLLDALQELSARLLADHPEEMYRRVVQLARELLGASVAGLWLFESGRLRLQTTSPDDFAVRTDASYFFDYALTSRRPVVVALSDAKLSQALAASLLTDEDAPIGVLGVMSEPGQRLSTSDWDKKVLVLLARHAALAALNARRQALLRRLSPRERQVFDLMVAGLSNKAIAQTLVISPNTVKRHLRAIFDKLEVNSRAAAVAKVYSSMLHERPFGVL